MKVQERFRWRALTPCAHTRIRQDMSGKVIQRGDGGRSREGSKGKHLQTEQARIRQGENRTGHVRETSSNGVMDSGNVQMASTYSGLPKREREREMIGKVREVSSNGVMDEDSGNVQKASTHVDLRE